MQRTFLGRLTERVTDLRTDAVAAIENQAYYLASGDLSLWGQTPRLEITLANGQQATVRALGCTDLDVLVHGDGWQPGEDTPLLLHYEDLPDAALMKCADYAVGMKDVYHNDPADPEFFREDREFDKSDRLGRGQDATKPLGRDDLTAVGRKVRAYLHVVAELNGNDVEAHDYLDRWAKQAVDHGLCSRAEAAASATAYLEKELRELRGEA